MKKLNFETIIKILLPLVCIALAILLIASCSDNDDIITLYEKILTGSSKEKQISL